MVSLMMKEKELSSAWTKKYLSLKWKKKRKKKKVIFLSNLPPFSAGDTVASLLISISIQTAFSRLLSLGLHAHTEIIE